MARYFPHKTLNITMPAMSLTSFSQITYQWLVSLRSTRSFGAACQTLWLRPALKQLFKLSWMPGFPLALGDICRQGGSSKTPATADGMMALRLLAVWWKGEGKNNNFGCYKLLQCARGMNFRQEGGWQLQDYKGQGNGWEDIKGLPDLQAPQPPGYKPSGGHHAECGGVPWLFTS